MTENIKKTSEPVKKKAVQIADRTMIKVKSIYYGQVNYKNKISGEQTIWENMGDIQLMSFGELRTMKAQQVRFFKDQWIMIVGVADGENCVATPAEICHALVIDQYYKNFINPEDFGTLCEASPDVIKERVSLMSDAAKDNLIVALNELIASGTLDSIKKIKAFEEVLGCELRENI